MKRWKGYYKGFDGWRSVCRGFTEGCRCISLLWILGYLSLLYLQPLCPWARWFPNVLLQGCCKCSLLSSITQSCLAALQKCKDCWMSLIINHSFHSKTNNKHFKWYCGYYISWLEVRVCRLVCKIFINVYFYLSFILFY